MRIRSTLDPWSIIAIVIAGVLVLIRVLPMGGPRIFSDEYVYAAWSSALFHGTQTPPPLAASLGNWLYLRVYGGAFVGVGPFLVKVRVLNAVISAFAAGVLTSALRTAEPGRKPQLAMVLSIGFVAALLGAYAAYFMPEAPYFAGVCFWLYCTTKYAKVPCFTLALATGIVGGMVTMTKAHGILLLPATLATFILIGWRIERRWERCIVDAVILVLGWFACTTVISLLLGNDSGINPVGSFYSELGLHAAETMGSDRGHAIVQLCLQHIATVVAIAGMPILLSAWLAFAALLRPLQRGYHSALQFPAFALGCMLVGMLAVTVVFTVSVAGSGIYETLSRLHGRYYEHFAILAACFGIIGSHSVLSRWSLWVRAWVFGLFVVLLVLAWQALQAVKGQYPVDFSIAYAMFAEPSGRLLAVSITGISALLALACPKHSSTVLACALLIWLGFNTVSMERHRWPIQEQAAGRVAAMVAADEAGATPPASIEIVGSGATVPVYRAAFHLLNERIGFALGSAVQTCNVDGRTPDWVIMVDGTRDPCGYPEDIHIGDVTAGKRFGPSTAALLPDRLGKYRAKLTLVGQPEVTADGKGILVTVNVTNDGSSEFGSSSEPHNVNLGAHSISSDGEIVTNDLARGHLPPIPPGETEEASIVLPIEGTVGHRVELLPVQEDVAWFDRWGNKALVVGPFLHCSLAAMGEVCDASGRPLPVVVAKHSVP